MTAEADPGGDRWDQFEDFYRAHWAPMVRLAWLMTGSREDGEDLVHDAFVRVEPRFAELDTPSAYLRRTVVNGAFALRRREQVERRHRPLPAPPHVDPEVEEIWSVVRALPDRQRHALVFRFHLDLTVEQTAEALGCPLGTAKSLIHRGVANVRRRLEPCSTTR